MKEEHSRQIEVTVSGHFRGGAYWRSTYRTSYLLNFESRRSLEYITSHDQRSREGFDHACWWEE